MNSSEDVEARFSAVWDRRRQPPRILRSWVNSEWAKGRRRYLAFLLRVNDATVVPKVLDLQRALGAFPCIDPLPIHYFHITVKGVGFLESSKQYADDVAAADVDRIIDQAAAVLKAVPSFEACLTRLTYFSEVICLEVHEANHIRSMNRALLAVPGVSRLPNDFPRFLPHFSVAQFRSNEGFDDVINYLEAHRATSLGGLTLNTVDLVIAHLPRSGRYPWLETLHEFRLG